MITSKRRNRLAVIIAMALASITTVSLNVAFAINKNSINKEANSVGFYLDAVDLSETNSTLKTSKNNDVNFEVYKYNTTGSHYFLSGGYIRNTSPIAGLERISIPTNYSSGITISYGWELDEYVIVDDTITGGPTDYHYTFNGEKPTYFRIENKTGSSVQFTSFSIYYTCSETSLPAKYDLITYWPNEDDGYTAKFFDNSITVGNIRSTYNGKPVTRVGNLSISLPNLERVNIPSSVKIIENQAFYGCNKLAKVNFSNGLEEIGARAFSDCEALTEIIMPDTVTTLGEECFRNFTYSSNIKKVHLSSSLTSIPDSAFYGQYRLTDIGVIPNTVISIGDYAFYYTSFTEMIIPTSVVSIASTAFSSNTATLYVCHYSDPVGYESGWNSGNTTYYFSENPPDGDAEYWHYVNNKITIWGTVVTLNPGSGSVVTPTVRIIQEKEYTLETPTCPEGYDFDGWYNGDTYIPLTGTWTIYDSEITLTAKYYTSKIECHLSSKNFGVASSKDNTISGEVVIPDVYHGIPITYIGSFSNTSITSITLPDTIDTIEVIAFEGCSSLAVNHYGNGKYLPLGNNPYFALIEVSGQSVNMHDDCELVIDGCFESKTISEVHLSTSLKKISRYCFYTNTSITSITIPNSVTSIETNAFYQCNISSVTIPSNATRIGDMAFYETDIVTLTIPSKCVEIGRGAFRKCDSLTNITINGQITTLAREIFQNCGALQSVTLPNSLKTIDKEAFKGCTSLTNINIPNGVTSIGTQAFLTCTSLSKLVIPSSVTTIESAAISNCPNLTIYVEFEEIPSSWNANWNPDGITVIYYSELPASVADTYWHYSNNVPTLWTSKHISDVFRKFEWNKSGEDPDDSGISTDGGIEYAYIEGKCSGDWGENYLRLTAEHDCYVELRFYYCEEESNDYADWDYSAELTYNSTTKTYSGRLVKGDYIEISLYAESTSAYIQAYFNVLIA